MIGILTLRRKAFPPIALLTVLLSGCGAPRCPSGAEAMQVYHLYFGRSIKGRVPVSDKEWLAFRDQVVTPALPHGYTVFDGQGAWLQPGSRATGYEATKILVVALPDTPDSAVAIARVRLGWQRWFHQYSVGMTVQNGCGSFSPVEAPR